MPEAIRPAVHLAMGGEDPGEWFLYPERPAIIIGTQDMLISRALNRGYAAPRARWPMEFGLLNHDALWVMDEVQLMDVGLATSGQLQAFRQQDQAKHLRPCHTWWMSASLQPDWLKSVDTEQYWEEWIRNPCQIPLEQRSGGLWDVRKSLATDIIPFDDDDRFAQRILEEHQQLIDGDFGRITLVMCNTVERACRTFAALHKQGRKDGLELVHSRFRPAEREVWLQSFLSRDACTRGVDRIIVATQVVEAGVDISAGCLVTEVAPWSSLVQRFGRCARYGGSGTVLVVKRGDDERSALPYSQEECDSAWDAVTRLVAEGVGLAALEAFELSLSRDGLKRLYRYAPRHLLLRREFDELFDTTPDLTGADIDISRFIRSGEERDLHVFWIDLPDKASPAADRRPHRRELCAIPFLKARDWLCGAETKSNKKQQLHAGMRAWIWDWLDGAWRVATRESLLPGRVVCVAAECGGYSRERGFDPDESQPVPEVQPSAISREIQALDEADDQQDGEQLSINPWKTLACHSAEVAQQARVSAEQLGIAEMLQDALELAAIFHDWGKAHPAFQGAIRGDDRPPRYDLAKAPEQAWLKPPRMYRYPDDSDERPAFRHELASALGLFALLRDYAPRHPALLGPWVEVLKQLGKVLPSDTVAAASSPLLQRLLACSAETFDLVAYLVVSHHGKVRVALHAAPRDQEYLDRDGRGLPIHGVREGDRLPAVELVPGEPPLPEVVLTLAPAGVGLSEQTGISWGERCLALLQRYGPAALAFLEAILRAADVRASRLKTNDPALEGKANK
jgi:CRISPR-associated endonuclease/helicase Cas3